MLFGRYKPDMCNYLFRSISVKSQRNREMGRLGREEVVVAVAIAVISVVVAHMLGTRE